MRKIFAAVFFAVCLGCDSGGGSGDGGSECECAEDDGPCCDGCKFYTLENDEVCETVDGYRCSDTECGADVEKRTGVKKCQGETAECTGSVGWGDFEVDKSCGANEACQAVGDSAECSVCEHGCAGGACWAECDPGEDQCCDTDGTKCDQACRDGACRESCDTAEDDCCEPDGLSISWRDSTTGLCWEDPIQEVKRPQRDAESYCTGLGAGWHLPSIDELRSLIRGCESSETDGACAVTHGSGVDAVSEDCDGCEPRLGGPGQNGCYWDPELSGSCEEKFWSSSKETTDATFRAWMVTFTNGRVYYDNRYFSFFVRCVRQEP